MLNTEVIECWLVTNEAGHINKVGGVTVAASSLNTLHFLGLKGLVQPGTSSSPILRPLFPIFGTPSQGERGLSLFKGGCR